VNAWGRGKHNYKGGETIKENSDEKDSRPRPNLCFAQSQEERYPAKRKPQGLEKRSLSGTKEVSPAREEDYQEKREEGGKDSSQRTQRVERNLFQSSARKGKKTLAGKESQAKGGSQGGIQRCMARTRYHSEGGINSGVQGGTGVQREGKIREKNGRKEKGKKKDTKKKPHKNRAPRLASRLMRRRNK